VGLGPLGGEFVVLGLVDYQAMQMAWGCIDVLAGGFER
jgi:hypothetical protein